MGRIKRLTQLIINFKKVSPYEKKREVVMSILDRLSPGQKRALGLTTLFGALAASGYGVVWGTNASAELIDETYCSNPETQATFTPNADGTVTISITTPNRNNALRVDINDQEVCVAPERKVGGIAPPSWFEPPEDTSPAI